MDRMGIVICFVLVIICFGIYLEFSKKQNRKKLISELRKKWGRPSDREYTQEELDSISHYYKNICKKEQVQIDDITWNDLDMDSIFILLNNTCSSIGEEYLYYTLRTPKTDEEPLRKQEFLVNYFAEHEEERLRVQEILNGIGRTRNVSVTDYIDRLVDLKEESNGKHYVKILLLFLAAASVFIQPAFGIIALVAVIGYNIKTYYSRKGEIENYFITFVYLLKLLNQAEKLSKLSIAPMEEERAALQATMKKFRKFRKNSYILIGSTGIGDSISELLMDYVRILTHLDIIKFNRMLKKVKSNLADMNQLMEIVGRMETAIAIASFRELLPYYCIPELKKGRSRNMEIENLYHPLITEPVANSITENRCVLLTGSNASGKSTFLKTVAINAILAQTVNTSISTCYRADYYKIYSSMALQDNLMGQESYYIVEIKSLKRILDQINDDIPVLCFIDEVLRGTNTVERIAASSQILFQLSKKNVLCFAATHDIELTQILKMSFANYHFQEEVKENDILFDYVLYKGEAVSRNAIKLLKMMGYTAEITEAAEAMAGHFMEEGSWTTIASESDGR